jgi:hypothetical protein
LRELGELQKKKMQSLSMGPARGMKIVFSIYNHSIGSIDGNGNRDVEADLHVHQLLQRVHEGARAHLDN